MAASFFSELVRYVRFGPADEAALRALHPAVAPSFAAIADVFYDRLREFPGAVEVFDSTEQVERLKVTLRSWLDRLLAGPWDEAYCEVRSRIGRVHVKVGLPQRYMFTSMAVVHGELLAIAERACGNDRERFAVTANALSKIHDIELAIMLETFSEDYIARVRRLERAERDLLERRLEISEARSEAIVESAEVLIVAVDDTDRIRLFNQKAVHVSGYLRAEALGERCVDLLCPPDDRDAMAGILAAARSTGAEPFEGRLSTRTGDERWIRWHVTPLAGDSVLVCAIGIDVTDERELHKRTVRAERLATLGTLAAGLAHEIRNPLNAAQLQLMLVDRRIGKHVEARPELASALEASALVQAELKRLGGLVQDFLGFARPTVLRPAQADIATSVDAIVALIAPDAERMGVDLTTSVEPIAVARFDEERIKQVLLNLLRNALEAAGEGGDVGVAVTRRRDALLIEVSDSGDGIPEDTDIFEPFVTTKHTGTGLGLPIAHRIVSAHGGDLTVERRDSRTVFVIELPVNGPPEEAR